MPIRESELKSDRNRFLQVGRRQTVGDAFLLLASPGVDGQGFWHLVVLNSDGNWTAVQFSTLYEHALQDPDLLDTPLDRVEALLPIRSVERSALETDEATRLARSSPSRLLAVTEEGALVGIIFEGGMRGGGFPSQDKLRRLAASSKKALREHRYTDISCPRRVSRQTERFSLVVRLLLQPNPLSAAPDADVQPVAGRPVQVVLQAPGFEPLGPTSQQIDIQAEKDSSPAVFDLRPLSAGTRNLGLDFYQDGNPLGTVEFPIDVLEEPVGETAGELPPQRLSTAPGAACPDIVLRIVWNKAQSSLHFSLLRRGGTDWKNFPPAPLQQEPSRFAQDLFGELTRWSEAPLQGSSMIAHPQGLTAQQVDYRLKAVGQNLYRDALPEEFKRLYARQRDSWKDGTILVLSDEPYLPWELLWPYGDGWEDEEPWCLNLRMSRWLCSDERRSGNLGPPGRLPLSTIILLAADGSNLPLVVQERDFLVSLMNDRGIRSLQPDPVSWDQVMELLQGGHYDWLHMAGHGDFSPDAPERRSLLHLAAGTKLTPMEFVGPGVEGHLGRTRPAFVLNACHTGRQEFGLTRLDGWAGRLIGMGAGMFLGPLWAVSDRSAFRLTCSLYQALLDGLPLAEALRTARRAARESGSLSWLAYSLYGHPNAHLEVQPST